MAVGSVLAKGLLGLFLAFSGQSAWSQSASTDEAFRSIIAEADSLTEAGQVQDAWALLSDAATTATPGYLEALRQLALARVYLRSRDLSLAENAALQAMAQTENGLNTSPQRIEALFALGEALYQQGRLDEALPLLSRAVSMAGGRLALDRPGVRALHARAAARLALIKLQLDQFDAVTFAESVLDQTLGILPMPDWAWLHFNVTTALVYEGRYNPDTVTRQQALLALIANDPAVSDADRIYYSGYLGLFLADQDQHAQAQPILAAWYDQMLADGDLSDALFLAGQRLVQGEVLLGQIAPATARLMQMIDLLQGQQGRERTLAYLLRDRALIAEQSGDMATAQAFHRRAFDTFRLIRSETDPELMVFAASLTDTDPANQTFADLNGDLVLERFLSGDHAALLREMQQLYDDGTETPAFWANRQLLFALAADPAQSGTAMDEMTLFYLDAGSDAIPADDRPRWLARVQLVEAVSRVFSTSFEQDAEELSVLFQDIAQSQDILPPWERRLAVAIRAMWLSRRNHNDQAEELVRQWFAEPAATPADGPWAMLSELIGLSTAMAYLPADDMARRLDSALPAAADMPLITALLTVISLTETEAEGATDVGIARMGQAVGQIRTVLPASHYMTVLALSRFATQLELRASYDAAFEALDAAVAGARLASGWISADVHAYLQMRQGLLRKLMGQDDLALALTAEAVSLLDATTTDPSIALEIVTVHASALVQAARSEDALTLIESWSAAFAALPGPGLEPGLQAVLQASRASVLAQLERYSDADLAFQDAQSLMLRGRWATDVDRAGLLVNWSVSDFRQGKLASSYDRIVQANTLYLDWFTRSDARQAASLAQTARQRVLLQARIGWDYAATLQP